MVDLGKKLLQAASENDVDSVKALMTGGAPFTGNWVCLVYFALIHIISHILCYHRFSFIFLSNKILSAFSKNK